jgi:predicted 2-oxoglutarate/Fe(II)-dependent dioxygenase YbiX
MGTSPTTVPRFVPGDSIPDIGFLGRDGRIVQLFRQDLAGTTLALWRTGPDVSPGDLAEAEQLTGDFGAIEAHLIHLVVGAQPADVPSTSAGTTLTQIFDPRNEIAPLFGLTGKGLIVIDRNRRFLGATAGQGPREALVLCRDAFAREPGGMLAAQAPVLLVPGIFDTAEASSLIDYWHASEKDLVNNVASATAGNTYDGPQIKRRIDAAIQDRRLFDLVKTRIERRVFPEIVKSFQCTIARMEMPRIGCYDSAMRGEFRRHRDNTTPYTAHRKFALSINLNDRYEGGAIGFPEYGRMAYRPPAGGGVVFSCSLLHEALPVLTGKRFGLFTFFTDAEGGKREDEMFAKHGSGLNRYTVR